MHIIGDGIFWDHADPDQPITEQEALRGILHSAKSIGRKYFDPNVLSALQSADYRLILKKLVEVISQKNQLTFTRAELSETLTPTERKKLDNFLRRMTGVKAFVHLDKGLYGIPNRMIWVYLVVYYATQN